MGERGFHEGGVSNAVEVKRNDAQGWEQSSEETMVLWRSLDQELDL